MKKTIAAIALVGALMFTALPAAEAGGWWGWGRSKPAPTAPAPTAPAPTLSVTQKSLLTAVLNNVALTDIELSPFGRAFLNAVLKGVMPAVCPIVANAAAPDFRPLVLTGCQGIAVAPDPYAALLEFLPLACQLKDTIFPDYKALLGLACELLY